MNIRMFLKLNTCINILYVDEFRRYENNGDLTQHGETKKTKMIIDVEVRVST